MKMKFENYGELEWLEPEDFYVGVWKILSVATGEDGQMYDIVYINGVGTYYTII